MGSLLKFSVSTWKLQHTMYVFTQENLLKSVQVGAEQRSKVNAYSEPHFIRTLYPSGSTALKFSTNFKRSCFLNFKEPHCVRVVFSQTHTHAQYIDGEKPCPHSNVRNWDVFNLFQYNFVKYWFRCLTKHILLHKAQLDAVSVLYTRIAVITTFTWVYFIIQTSPTWTTGILMFSLRCKHHALLPSKTTAYSNTTLRK